MLGFDPAQNFAVNDWPVLFFCNNEMLQGDWSKGLAGTGETDWMAGYLGHISLETGSLAETWELPDASTIIYHIRHGVRFWSKPPVNGRELTANDVAWSMNREWQAPKSFLASTTIPAERPISITATDKYTVELKVPDRVQGALLFLTGDQCHIFPTEVSDYTNWRTLQGSGPFVLTDYVSGSSLTYERNPNYWDTDPVGPGKGNQLPYIEDIKQFVIPDRSTFLSALRTGKIDSTSAGSTSQALSWDDVSPLIKANSDMQMKTTGGAPVILYGRLDKPELPFQDIRVRQALNMAVDKQAIVKDYYGGQAHLFGVYYPPLPAWKNMFTPLEQLPQEAQDLFKYDPVRAKKLLGDAGYPDGFKASIVCGSADSADYLSMVKQYFDAVKVSLEIKQVEPTVFTSIVRGRTYDQMIFGTTTAASFPWKLSDVRKEMSDDVSFFEDPKTREAYNQINQYVGKDDAKWEAILKTTEPYMLSQAIGVYMPLPYGYRLWWPWLKNYHGEGTIGYDNQMAYAWYAWIDQDLKKSLGH